MPTSSLILGGVKSGKSGYAEKLASSSSGPVCVIATAMAGDAEMADRIKHHQLNRNPAWRVLEIPLELGSAVSTVPGETCLIVDCLTLWLTNLLVADDEALFNAQRERFLSAVRFRQGPLILVSNETNMGIVPLGKLSRRYCDEVGLLHQELATLSDEVVLMVAGLPHHLKTAPPLPDKSDPVN